MTGEPKKLKVTTAADLANRIKIDNKTPKLGKVDVPDLPELKVTAPSAWQLLAAWFKKYLTQQVTTTGEVQSPLAGLSSLTGLAKNWWKLILVLVVLAGIGLSIFLALR